MTDAIIASVDHITGLLGLYNLAPGRFWYNLRELCKRSWWDRAWILQEVAFPQPKILLCGEQIIDQDGLRIAIFYASQYMDERFSNGNALDVIDFDVDHQEDTGLISLLYRCWRSRSTDDRDKVYVILGLATDVQPEEIAPDYDLYLDTIYIQAALWSIRKYENLDILGRILQKREWKSHLPRFPSAVNHLLLNYSHL